MLKKSLKKLLPWVLIILGFASLDYFKAIPGGVAIILGLTIIIDRILPVPDGLDV